MQYVIASGIFEQIIRRHKGLLKIKEGCLFFKIVSLEPHTEKLVSPDVTD